MHPGQIYAATTSLESGRLDYYKQGAFAIQKAQPNSPAPINNGHRQVSISGAADMKTSRQVCPRPSLAAKTLTIRRCQPTWAWVYARQGREPRHGPLALATQGPSPELRRKDDSVNEPRFGPGSQYKKRANYPCWPSSPGPEDAVKACAGRMPIFPLSPLRHGADHSIGRRKDRGQEPNCKKSPPSSA